MLYKTGYITRVMFSDCWNISIMVNIVGKIVLWSWLLLFDDAEIVKGI